MAYHNARFKTGSAPAIANNQFLICYRLHPRSAVSFSDLDEATQTALAAAWLPAGRDIGYFFDDFQRLGPDAFGHNAPHDVFSDTIQACVRLRASDLPAHATLSCGDSSTTMACTEAETIVVVNGAIPVTAGTVTSFGNVTKYEFGGSQIGATPHLTVTRDSDGAVLKDADGPLPISPYIVPGGYNMLATEL